MIPTSSALTPTLSFLPDEVTGSWLHQGMVKSSEVGSAIEQIPEQKIPPAFMESDEYELQLSGESSIFK